MGGTAILKPNGGAGQRRMVERVNYNRMERAAEGTSLRGSTSECFDRPFRFSENVI